MKKTTVYPLRNRKRKYLQVNLLSGFVTTDPLFVASKAPDDFWLHFTEVYDPVYP